MAATIQHIELPKKPRALDSSTSVQEVSQELIRNADFSTNESETQTYLNGGVQFDDWVEQQSSGLRAFTTVTGGIRCTAETVTTETWHQRIYQTLDASQQVVGQTYKVKATVLCSRDASFRFNVQETNSTDDQWSPENYDVDAGVERTVEVVYTCTDATSQALIFFPLVILTAGQYYEVKNVSLKQVENFSNNNHGKIYSGRALEFDGVADYFQNNGGTNITGVNTFEDGSPWTFACWMYFNSSSAQFFVGEDGQTKPHFNKSSSDKLRFREDSTGDYYELNTSKIPMLTWCRMVWVTDGTTITAYINGVFYGSITKGDASTAGDGTVLTSTKMHFTGWGAPYETGGSRGYVLDGMMSDGQVWDAAWTADDAAYDYANPESLALNASGTALTEGNLKVWYPMQDGHRGQQSYILDGSNTGPVDEKIVNGDFSTSGTMTTSSNSLGWRLGHVDDLGTSISNGELILYNNGINGNYGRAYATDGSTHEFMTIGQSYKLTYTVSEVTGTPTLNYYDGGYKSGAATLGTHSYIFTTHTYQLFILKNSSSNSTIKLSNVSVKPINDKHHATTVFLGDELIASDAADNRTFDNDTGNWATYDDSGSDVSIANNSNKLRVTTTTDNEKEGAKLPIAHVGNGSATSIVAGRTYRVSANLDWVSGGFFPPFMYVGVGGALSSLFQVDTNDAVYTKDITAINNTGDLLFYTSDNLARTFDIDNVSVKEIGVASGWTDADQQLDIAQPALQSYNEMAWFDGVADYCEIADHDDFTFGTGGAGGDSAFSVSAWIYPNVAEDFPIVSKDGGSGEREWNFHLNAGGGLEFYAYDDSASAHIGRKYTTALATGKWHHVVGTYSGNEANSGFTLYVNGISVDDADKSSGTYVSMEPGTATLDIGKHVAGGKFANGCITEVTIFRNREIGAANVLELYNEGKAGDAMTITDASYIVGYWRNNGLSTWTDLSTNSHNGTPTSVTETLLCPQGVDGSRDAQGFIMNKARNTSSLNLEKRSYDYSPFKGGAYVEVADNSTLDFGTGAFTMMTWAKYDYQNTGSIYNVILSLGGNIASEDSGTGIASMDGKFVGRVFDDEVGNTDDDHSATLVKGDWYHLAVTLGTDNTATFYFNGAAGGTATITGDITNAYTKKIGMDSNLSRHYNEAIDGVLIYNDELTAAEVLRNYKATKGSHRN